MKNCLFLFLACFMLMICSLSAEEKIGAGKKIGVLWTTKSVMADRVLEGALKQLEIKAPGLEFEFKKELENDAAVDPVYQQWLKEKNALIFLRSDGAKYMKNNPPTIPAFIGACNSPDQLGAITNLNAPEGNMTGVTYFIKAIQHLKLYKSIFPNMKSIGLLLMKGHAGTPVDQSETQAACKELGLEYNEVIMEKVEELEPTVSELAKKVDLLIIGNQKLVMDNSGIIVKAAGERPVVSYAEAPVTRKDALIGLVASDEKLGRMLADSLVEVVINGKPVSSVPVKLDDQPRILLCLDKMKQWKVNIPLNILKIAEKIE